MNDISCGINFKTDSSQPRKGIRATLVTRSSIFTDNYNISHPITTKIILSEKTIKIVKK